MKYQEQMQRGDNESYVAMLSGGRNSSAMVIKMLEEGYPLDHIIFNDTTNEHPEMYEYIDKLSKYILDKYGFEVIITKPASRTFEEAMFRKTVKGERKGDILGIPNISVACYWRKESKIAPTDKWITKNLKGLTVVKYLGFTPNEVNRFKDDENEVYPLCDFKMSDKDCQEFLEERCLENGLYRHFKRTGCAFCPFQSESDKRAIYEYYPATWKKMEEIEENLKATGTQYWEFHQDGSHRTLKEIAKQFNKNQLLFRNDEPIRDCFCKV